ncbi:hypothetical protein AcV7_005619 [Taiwanofungus camphoratus]|nr:hypothetical protein AcV7_005619 [Antrodia cinnamomea]
MVRLITHNLLACHAKGCTSNNFPLQFKDAQIEIRDAEFNPDFLRGFIPRIEWAALVNAARQVSIEEMYGIVESASLISGLVEYQLGDTSLPDEPPEMLDDEFLQKLHHVLFQIHVEEGAMICPNCQHSYLISNGIPNMLLTEHEIG